MIFDWDKVDSNTIIPMVFYGRVSTEHEAQLEAFKNQLQWYEDQLKMHPNWKLVEPIETYLDKGITGTQAKKRPGFLHMINDAKSGKFAMVVTRDVCRFARNTVDTLAYARQLKEIGIQIYFVFDNIKTIQDNDGEYRLTIMANNAQEESRRISERAKAGQYISRANGVLYGTGNILGYKRIRRKSDPDKKNAIGDKSVPTFEVVPEQAETVRLIFEMYAEGYGLKRIKNYLEQNGYKTATGKTKWFESSLSRILGNPMYIGKQYQCQTEVLDFLSHRVKKNSKEDYVLIEGDFEPIISEELFQKVQEIRASKVVKAGFTGKSHGVRQSKDKWILKLECGCGSGFQRYKWRTNASTGEEIGGYACRHRVIDGSTEFRKSKGMPIDDTCSLPSIPEWKLDYMALEIFKKIWGNQADTIFEVYRLISQNYHIEQVKTRESPEYLEKQIQKCQSRLVALVDLYTDGDISLEVYRSKRDEYTSRMETLKAQLEEITANSSNTQEELIKERLIAIKQLLDDMALCNKEKSPNELINNFVDKIVVRSQTEFEWYININGNAEKYIAENCPKIHNEPYRDRAEKIKKLRDSSYYNIFRLHIGFDEVRAFKKRFGKFIRQSQWKDTDVVVYMR